MFETLSRLVKFTESTVARLKVRSALNPALWLAGVTGTLGLIGALLTAPPIQYFMVGFMFIGAVVSMIGFFLFAFRDPSKLRSEDYELQNTALNMIEEKGGSIRVEAASVEATANIDYSPQASRKPGENDK